VRRVKSVLNVLDPPLNGPFLATCCPRNFRRFRLTTPEWLDHPLKGDWDGHRECHVGGDFLLVYRLAETPASGLIVFVRAGTHADLFE